MGGLLKYTLPPTDFNSGVWPKHLEFYHIPRRLLPGRRSLKISARKVNLIVLRRPGCMETFTPSASSALEGSIYFLSDLGYM